jgi:fructokinase
VDVEAVDVIGLGELLWDDLPTGRRMGGAPANFAFHCRQLGLSAAVLSRVGADRDGVDLRAALRDLGLPYQWVQVDPVHPTGTVKVHVDADGQPSYVITPEVAYDYLEATAATDALARTSRVVCFGTLAQRHPFARAAVRRTLAAASRSLTVCDLNLRPPFIDRGVIEESLKLCRWLKLNDHELATLAGMLPLTEADESGRMAALRRRYGLELVCLTRGAAGCRVQTAEAEADEPGVPVAVVDAVGAGDAFTAALVAATLEGRPLAEAARRANRLAAAVAGSPGATPRLDVTRILGDAR